jgi:ATP-dependent protease HslVU (ClpYQ) peptidase subunit
MRQPPDCSGAEIRVRALVLAVNPDATFVVRSSGDVICAESTAPASIGILLGITITASACALDDSQN